MMDIKPFLIMAGVSFSLNNITPIPPEPVLTPGYVTVYCDEGTTASGTKTHKGICASMESRLGKTIILYQRLPDNSIGTILGYYECEDTGCTPGLMNGTVVDVWRPADEVQDYINKTYEDGCEGRVYIQVLED